jgi:hypothetical protein
MDGREVTGMLTDQCFSFVNSLYQMRAAISFSGEKVAAMRRLRNRRYRNPADPKVSHAQPPLHSNADTKNAPANVSWGAGAPASYPGSQARSLNWQRRV